MSKIVLDEITSGYQLSKVNENFQRIEDELNNRVLYRNAPDGEANTVEKDIDLNGKKLYNVGDIQFQGFDSLEDLLERTTTAAEESEASKNAAEVAAENAAISAASASTYSGSAVVRTFSGDGSTVAFNLTATPRTKENTQVYIGSVYQRKSTYSVTDNILTFNTAPPVGTNNIEVVIFESVFVPQSGYTIPVAYSSGIVLSQYNQLVEYNSEFYKLKAGQAPYTTTGTWETDSAKLVSVGDAALRQELAAGDGAEKVGYQVTGGVVRDVAGKLGEFVSVKDFGAVGDGVTDDTAAIQAAIDYCMKQYDPSQTTHNGNDVTYMNEQKTLFIPVGRYAISSTLNLSFRNHIEMVGENEWNTVLFWTGALDGMVIDARCSNYVKFRNFTIDGNFKALTFIYCAGNGNNAPASKGNVTGNYFGHIYFWNQKGNLVPPFVDYPDQYNPLTAMLNTISIDTPTTFFNSMDDSLIEFCRFAPNSLNNFYAIGASSNLVIKNCQFYAANGILCYNGAQLFISDCVASNYAPEVQDSQHNHAFLKFDYNAGAGLICRDIEMHRCYLEYKDYYGNNHSGKLSYWAQGVATAPENQGYLGLLISGGLYSGSAVATNYTYIDIQENRRANIKLVDAALQGPAKLYIYAPDSSVEISDHASSLTGFPQDTQTWQVSAANSVSHKYQTPEFQVEGSVVPTVSAVVGTTDLPGQLKFFSLDEALEFVSDCKGTVIIYLDQNDTVTRGGSLSGNVLIALQGYTLNINAPIINKGSLTIRNTFANSTRGGIVASTSKYLTNLGSLIVLDCSLNNAVTNENGTASFRNVDFVGTASTVLNNNAGKVVIDSVNCTFSGSGYVVDLGSKYGDVLVKNVFGAIPSSGLWMRGTRLEHDPSLGFPNQYWATSDGIGTAANWGHSGNLV